eukprot:CAMPEP_0116132784 /NCGR_PEP_ID=MMETSP0329-20121206/9743_1 /TAXON_ID=697910 /ORGANISM="Pseudo-nitzschia arenysensis, Strain B593" /LENGTH=536 /DNA_ID=CAMNT_0003627343 /DNA_START=242 /DNA_END=1852 /DNA_ORIENTATION=+
MTTAPRKRRRAFVLCNSNNSWMLAVVCWIALLLQSVVQAAVYLPVYNETFISLPARFGGQLSNDENDPPVVAYLTLVRDQPYMCSDELKKIQPKPSMFGLENDENNSTAAIDSEIDSSMRVDNRHNNSQPQQQEQPLEVNPNGDIKIPLFSDIANQDIVPLPPPEGDNQVPVALLVERGMCTFWEKAVMASQYGSFIKYVIIYDDQIAPDLVPMSSEYETDMTLLFVSAASGRTLRNYILMNSQLAANVESENNLNNNIGDNNNNNETMEEADDRFFGYNVVVHLDGTSPYFESNYRGLNMAAYFLAAMSGFLAFLIFFGCLLICAQCGCITAAPDEHGRIVLFAGGPGIRHTEGLARMIRVDKLTQDQVELLDEVEFEPSGEDEEGDSSECCAVCLEEFEPGEKVRVLPCGHKFHGDCLMPWLTERHASCPLCKMDVLKHVKELEAKQKGDNNDKSIEDGLDETASVATHSSSSPRSFWYRLRGWSLVDGGSPEVAAADSPQAAQGLGVSEIEMETWTSSSSNPSAATANTNAEP